MRTRRSAALVTCAHLDRPGVQDLPERGHNFILHFIGHAWEQGQRDGSGRVRLGLGKLSGSKAELPVVRLQVHGQVVQVGVDAQRVQ